MANLELVGSDLSGGMSRVTCAEAVKLLKQGRVVRVWWRPDGVLTEDSDNDLAYVYEVKR